jgi:flavin-dependent dehydrogenase
MTMTDRTALVAGAGPGGATAALLLAAIGFEVC